MYWCEIYGIDSLILEEEPSTPTDEFIKNNSTRDSMEDYVKNVGIYFKSVSGILGNSGYIKLYDNDTNTLIHTFTSADWNTYTATNPYMYQEGIKNVRIETSKTDAKYMYLYIYHIKEIDNEKLVEDYTKPEFDELAYIAAKYTAKTIVEGVTANETVKSQIVYPLPYRAPEAITDVTMNPSTITTNKIAENVQIVIYTGGNYTKRPIWKDGIFLLKFPEEILDVEINSVKTNNLNVTIQGYEVYKEGDNIFLKIYTANEEPEAYDITVNLNMAADPRIGTTKTNLALYACNPFYEIYSFMNTDIYDINQNGNISENVGYSTRVMDILAPAELITTQTISNYNVAEDITIAPGIAEIDKSSGVQTAKIDVNIMNNYTRTISDVVIVGKIPFTGNKSYISGKDLGSTYTTTMTSAGITLPPELVRNCNSILLRKRSCYKRHK